MDDWSEHVISLLMTFKCHDSTKEWCNTKWTSVQTVSNTTCIQLRSCWLVELFAHRKAAVVVVVALAQAVTIWWQFRGVGRYGVSLFRAGDRYLASIQFCHRCVYTKQCNTHSAASISLTSRRALWINDTFNVHMHVYGYGVSLRALRRSHTSTRKHFKKYKIANCVLCETTTRTPAYQVFVNPNESICNYLTRTHIHHSWIYQGIHGHRSTHIRSRLSLITRCLLGTFSIHANVRFQSFKLRHACRMGC